MICFRDRTYCVSTNCKNECGSKLTDEIVQAAKQWWLEVTNGREDDAPIAMSRFCGE